MDERLEKADAVVFDVGNVLLGFHVDMVAGLLPDHCREALIRAMFGEKALWSKFDLGAESNEDIAREIAACAGNPAWRQYPLDLLERFPDILYPLPLFGMLDELRAAGKRLYALTNYPEPSFTLTCERFPELLALDGLVVSAREKLAKPDSRIFELLIRRYGIQPETALYIDDLLPNAEAARKAGFRAWHYAGDDTL